VKTLKTTTFTEAEMTQIIIQKCAGLLPPSNEFTTTTKEVSRQAAFGELK
jgi:hypothetical protein